MAQNVTPLWHGRRHRSDREASSSFFAMQPASSHEIAGAQLFCADTAHSDDRDHHQPELASIMGHALGQSIRIRKRGRAPRF